MNTESVRLWRFTNPAGQRREPGPGSWRTGPTPPEISEGTEIEFAWALIADEPGEASGRAPSPGDQLIGFVEGHRGSSLQVIQSPGGLYLAMVETAGETHFYEADTCVDAVVGLLKEAGVGN